MRPLLSPAWRTALACPACKSSIGDDASSLRCAGCRMKYSVIDGIPSFAPIAQYWEDHGFTASGRTFNTPVIGSLALRLARRGFLRDIGLRLPRGSRVMELGCGGGSRFLAEQYDMLGADISIHSAMGAAAVYGSAIHTTAARLPLAAGSADGIVSICFMEHLGDDVVASALAEMRRVLRPGGVMIHYFDLDAEGPFHRWAKNQSWYNRIFVTSKQHDGLRPIGEWLKLMSDAGFRVDRERLLCRTWLQDLSVWAALDDVEVTGLPRHLGSAAASLRRRTDWLADTAVNLIDDGVGWMFPERWASKVMMHLVRAD